ncbi:MAG: BON domain-containing protein, partial [Granulosicoccus sp.]
MTIKPGVDQERFDTMKKAKTYAGYHHKILWIAAVTACLLASSCTMIPESVKNLGRTENTNSTDDNVARLVKAQLVASDDVEAAPLRISVEGDAIVLQGFVENSEQRTEAERLTQQLYPQYQVINKI